MKTYACILSTYLLQATLQPGTYCHFGHFLLYQILELLTRQQFLQLQRFTYINRAVR